ncbi:MAG: diguanylate cyclase [Chitinispirillales bacterium]|jgi:diguanylate cyclase (GGDEF)-like protein|nr:diguanylate cyclase [Chitinispirillales bacterium]
MELSIKKWAALTGAAALISIAVQLHITAPLREVAELAFIVLVWTIFIFTANSRGYLKNRFLLFLGIFCFFSGALRLFHIFTIHELVLFPLLKDGSGELFAFGARMAENTALLFSIFFSHTRLMARRVASLYGIICAAAVFSVYSGLLPMPRLGSHALTAVHIILAASLGASFLAMRKRSSALNPVLYKTFTKTIILSAVSEVLFFLSWIEGAELGGEVLRLWGWHRIYKAIVKSGLSDPCTFLFRDLKTAQETERTARVQAEKRTHELETLRVNISDMLCEHDSTKLLNAILSKAAVLVDAAGGELGLVNRQKREIEIKAVFHMAQERVGTTTVFGEGILGVVAQNRSPIVIHGHGIGQGRLPQYPFDQWNSIMAVPLEAGGKLYGVLSVVEKNQLKEFSKADLELLLMWAQHAAMSIRTVLLLERAQQEAQTDSLTGLYNHRSFFEMAKASTNRAVNERKSLCAMMFDIDFFKQVNDTFGHLTGDQVISSIAALCRQIFRKADIVGRYGGEEFAVILPETDIEVAKEAAERVRKGVEEMRFEAGTHLFSVSISAGVACLNEQCSTLGELIRRADEALYEAKNCGRNKICIWREESRAQNSEFRTQNLELRAEN